MAIGNNWTIDYTHKRVSHSGNATVWPTVELYSYLQDTFDELVQMDDPVPMSAQTPNAFTLINGWFIPDESFHYLDDGAVTTDGHDGSTYADGVRVLDFEATNYTNASYTDIGATVYYQGDTPDDTGQLLDYDNTLRKWWVRMDDALATFANITATVAVDNAGAGAGKGILSAASVTGESLWTNVYTLGTIESGTQIYIIQDGSKLTSWWSTGHIDVLVKVKEAGTEIDGAEITVFARQYSKSYDHFGIDLTAGGRQAVPLATANDLNNQTSTGTVLGYNDITFDFTGTYGNLNNGNGDRWYDTAINAAGRPLAEMYEYLKYVTRRTATKQLGGDTPTVDGEQYISASPTTYVAVKTAPFGTFAGGNFFGARGIWIHNYDGDDANNFQLIDASGITQSPPNTILVRITSLSPGDRYAVYRMSGGAINKGEFSASGAHPAGEATIIVTSAIDSTHPTSGYLRIVDDRYKYTSYSGQQFSLGTPLATAYGANSDVYVPFLEGTAATNIEDTNIVFSTAIDVRVRVRKKGIIPFQLDTEITSGGLTVAAIRTTDSIVQ